MFKTIGQEAVVRSLQSALKEGRLHHAYLLAGPGHVGKTTLALEIAQAVNCTGNDPPCGECRACQRIAKRQHADILVLGVNLDEEGDEVRSTVGIDAIRDLQRAAALRPYEGKKRVFIIQEAERLTQEAANALLKLLEEPPPDVMLLLLTNDTDAVLPTVKSRCSLLELKPLPVPRVASLLQDNYGVDPAMAERIAKLSRGCFGWAVLAAEDSAVMAGLHQKLERIADVCRAGLDVRFNYAEELSRRFQRDRFTGREEIYLWLRWWRDVLLIQQGNAGSITHETWKETLEQFAQAMSPSQAVRFTQRILETLDILDQNANARLAIEALMLEMPGR